MPEIFYLIGIAIGILLCVSGIVFVFFPLPVSRHIAIQNRLSRLRGNHESIVGDGSNPFETMVKNSKQIKELHTILQQAYDVISAYKPYTENSYDLEEILDNLHERRVVHKIKNKFEPIINNV